MPRLDFAFIADAAEAESGRKFYVIGGGVDSIAAPSFPVVHPQMALVLRLLVAREEMDAHHALAIRLIDPDGAQLAQVEGDFQAGTIDFGAGEVATNLVINFHGTRFERPGEHRLEIAIDGIPVKSLPLRLQMLTGPPPGHPG